ncbi:hypothetical protein [Streptomyces sp. DW26H14]|uniref:hypothetical protein n=1 Tax=Streptomyces sp. DW26H14 TaxID=3435395 RepID=UPI00403DA9CD
MSPYLRLITSDLDAYEADQARRAELQSSYLLAVDRWDRLGMAHIAAMASAYDQQHPGEQPVLDGIEAPNYPAAA